MKKLTVGKQIILGFSILFALAALFGGLAFVRMNTVKAGSERLDAAYIPEVAVSNAVERGLIMAMFNNRGYSFTEDLTYYEAGQEFAREALAALDEARELAEAQDLPGLKAQEPAIRDAISQYQEMVQETRSLADQLERYRGQMDESAATFLESIRAMLAGQERKLDADLLDRVSKVTLVTRVQELGNEARVANFKAQALSDDSHMDVSLGHLDAVLDELGKLKSITVVPADLELIAGVERAIQNYRAAIEAYRVEKALAAQADAAKLARLNSQMDQAAGNFTRQVKSFLEGQTEKLQADVDERIWKISYVNEILDLGNFARINNFKSQALRDPDAMQLGIERIEEMGDYFDMLKPITRDPEDIALMESTQAAADRYQTAMEGYLEAFLAMEDLNTRRNAVATQALEGAQNLARRGLEETTTIANDSVAYMNAQFRFFAVALVFALALGVTMAYFIIRAITRPLTQAIGNLSSGAGETNSASQQVSSASQSLAEGASEQAASLEETSSSMEEMTSMVARNAEVARKTNEQAREARSAAESGVRSMGELRERADAVSVSAQEMESAMQAIKQSSDSISKIIKTIDEIAFQTNILALNAAVEAARAGEAGAGFAVVADEVRSLARRAAEAAQETASMIEDSMERSERGVRVNETVGRNLKDVLEKANQVENGLKSITTIVSGVNDAMEELEASVKEQQDGINQINTAVNQVNEVTQSNAASAEEAASAAEEMSSQSDNLLEIVATLREMVSGSGSKNGSNGRNGHYPALAAPVRETKPVPANGRSTRKATVVSRSKGEKAFSLPGDFE